MILFTLPFRFNDCPVVHTYIHPAGNKSKEVHSSCRGIHYSTVMFPCPPNLIHFRR